MDAKHIEKEFQRCETRLNNHSERLDELEQYRAQSQTEIKNLIEQIKQLISTMKWAMGLTVGTLLSFFIWFVQGLGGR